MKNIVLAPLSMKQVNNKGDGDGDGEIKEIIKLAESVQSRLKKSGKQVHKCVTYFESDKKDRCITQIDIHEKDTIYIVAHGAPDVIGTGSSEVEYTPASLAKKLAKIKLPQKISKIKLFCCNSGVERQKYNICQRIL